MKKMLIVFGEIEYIEYDMAIIHEVRHSLCTEYKDPEEMAEKLMVLYGDYIIPQIYTGKIEWR